MKLTDGMKGGVARHGAVRSRSEVELQVNAGRGPAAEPFPAIFIRATTRPGCGTGGPGAALRSAVACAVHSCSWSLIRAAAR